MKALASFAEMDKCYFKVKSTNNKCITVCTSVEASSHNSQKLETNFSDLARGVLHFHEFWIRICVQGCKCLHWLVFVYNDKLLVKLSLFWWNLTISQPLTIITAVLKKCTTFKLVSCRAFWPFIVHCESD